MKLHPNQAENPRATFSDPVPVNLDDLLGDAESMLSLFQMPALARCVKFARRRLIRLADRLDSLERLPDEKDEEVERKATGETLTGTRVAVRATGARAWWQIPVEERDAVIALLQKALTPPDPDPVDHLSLGREPEDAPHAEALRAAVEMLSPDWRTSVLTQLASLRATELDNLEVAEVDAAQDALEMQQPFATRPVFESDVTPDAPMPPGLRTSCEICGVRAESYCDPKGHPEVPGEG